MNKTNVARDDENNTLVFERVIDAPRKELWQAWTDPERFVKWWGPRGWQTSVKQMEVQSGGELLYCMECVDKNQGDFYGQQSCGKSVYEEVEEPRKLVYQDYFTDEKGRVDESMPVATSTVKLEELETKTKLTTKAAYQTAEDLQRVLDMGIEQGVRETLDRLAEQATRHSEMH